MVLGKKVAIYDWEWGQIRALEMGRKGPGTGSDLRRQENHSSKTAFSKFF